MLVKVFFVVVCFVTVFCVGLFLMQHRMIYPNPRSYSSEFLQSLGSDYVALEYKTSAGVQRAFYVQPKDALPGDIGSLPQHIWFLFNGMGGLALGWRSFIEKFPADDVGFVLIDYPGFGSSQGEASPETTDESAKNALAELARIYKVSPEIIEQRLSVLGVSFGTGPAAQFAAARPISKVVLVSPFSSLFDAACDRWAKPLCYLLRYHYETADRLAELLLRREPPRIYIFHGERDGTLKVENARRLAQVSPERITYHEYPEEGHGVLFSKENEIFAAMLE
jgi:pimeloyl-ACP methyl ester carboxylesterase